MENPGLYESKTAFFCRYIKHNRRSMKVVMATFSRCLLHAEMTTGKNRAAIEILILKFSGNPI